MKRLYLLRHAKSSWSDAGLDDHDRPLAKRGRRAARRLAKRMQRAGIRPALVLCSSSRRTGQTLRLLRPVLGARSKIRIDKRLYGATADEVLQILRHLPKRLPSALVVGHNPGLQDLALALARPGTAREKLRAQFPTAALAALKIRSASWRKLGHGAAKIVGYCTSH